MSSPIRRYEDGAVRQRPPEGWVCVTCRRWWADDEHMARWCCATDLPCRCGGRTYRGSTACDKCRRLQRDAKWEKTPKAPLPADLSKEPLCTFDDDRCFFDMESVYDHAASSGVSVRDLRLMICSEVEPPTFNMAEWLTDHMPEDSDSPDDSHDEEINRRIRLAAPTTFYPTNTGVDPETIPLDEGEVRP